MLAKQAKALRALVFAALEARQAPSDFDSFRVSATSARCAGEELRRILGPDMIVYPTLPPRALDR